MKRTIGIALLASFASLAFAQNVLFDSGVNNPTVFNGTLTNLGFSSGYVSDTLPERWYAVPFSLSGASTINEVHARGFLGAGSFATLKVHIYSRSSLATAPTAGGLLATGSYTQAAGAQFLPEFDPRFPDEGASNIARLYKMPLSSPISLAAGDYWISIYAADPLTTDLNFPVANFAWFVGAHGDNILLNREAGFWRQATLAGGFVSGATAANTPYSFMGDPAERWNASFTLLGTTSGKVARNVSGNTTFSNYIGNEAPYDDTVNFKPLDFLYRVAITDPNNADAILAWRYLRTMTQASATVNQTVLTTMPYEYRLPVATAATVTAGDVVFKTNSWLSVRNSHDLTLLTGDTTRDWVLVNGDIDGNNEVGPGDFTALSAAFGQSGDTVRPGWDTWIASTAGAADLNEDGEVGPGDFTILSTNFGTEGE